MRISALLAREPFGDIMSATLSTFLTSHLGTPRSVRWSASIPRRTIAGQQLWLCNPYLNVVFQPDAPADAFDDARRNFGRSVRRWRQPFQHAYVGLATHPWSRRLFASAALTISPPLPDASGTILLGGNHRVRMLDRDRGRAYVICKAGFPRTFMKREIEGRQAAGGDGVNLPAIYRHADDYSWFEEALICGTPVNRLADRREAKHALDAALSDLRRLAMRTLIERDGNEYVNATARAILSRAERWEGPEKTGIRTAVDNLARLATRGGSVALALTHGDFQAGNVLVSGRTAWLIDWEYSGIRQALYDPLVFTLGSRFPRGLAARVRALRADGSSFWTEFAAWPGAPDADRRIAVMALFTLEEALTFFEESDNPHFTRLPLGPAQFVEELPAIVGALR